MGSIKHIKIGDDTHDIVDSTALHNNNNGGTGTIIGEGSTVPSTATNYLTEYGVEATGSTYTTAIGYRAGYTNGSTTEYGVMIGYNTQGKNYSVAIGSSANCTDTNGVAIGWSASATNLSVAIGNSASNNSSSCSVAIGASSSTSGSFTTSIGYNSRVTSAYGVAVGTGTKSGNASVSVGYGAQSTSSYGVAVGYSCRAYQYSVSMGYNSGTSSTRATYNVCIGYNAKMNSNSNVCIGQNVYSDNTYASGNVCIGCYSGPLSANKSDSCYNNVCIGNSACVGKAIGGAIQIGTGTNGTAQTVQFFNYPVLDSQGKFFSDRMPPVVLQGTTTMPDPLKIPLGSTMYYTGPTTSEYTQNTMYMVTADYTQEQPCFLDSLQTTYSGLFSSITIDNTNDKFLNYIQNAWNCHFGKGLDVSSYYYNNTYTYLYYDNQTTNKFWIYGLSGGYGDIEEENYHYNDSDKLYFTQSELESLLGITINDWNPSVFTTATQYNWICVVCMSSKMWLYPRGDGADSEYGGSSAQGYKLNYALLKAATADYQNGDLWRWEWDSVNSVWKVMVNGDEVTHGSGGTLIETVTTSVLMSKYGFLDGNNHVIAGNESHISYIYATIGTSYKPIWTSAEKTIDTMLRSLTGYDSTVASQSLKVLNGVPQWVTD